jgi:hypothetical protein
MTTARRAFSSVIIGWETSALLQKFVADICDSNSDIRRRRAGTSKRVPNGEQSAPKVLDAFLEMLGLDHVLALRWPMLSSAGGPNKRYTA